MEKDVIERHLGAPLPLECKFSGIPSPTIRWFKDDIEYMPDVNDTRIRLNEDKSSLYIQFIQAEDEGKYKCEGSNRLGTIAKESTLRITSKLLGDSDPAGNGLSRIDFFPQTNR